MAAAASPDRRSIAIDLLGGIWILPFRGGEAKRITPELLEARQPTWSPDSQSIAFQGYDDGTWHIYVIPRDGGEAKAITSGAFDDREPAWSHDGSRIAFSSDRYGGITTIWTVAVASGELRQISKRDGWMPTWSPDDQEITFVSADAATDGGATRSPGLWAVSADGRERLHLPTDVDRVEGIAAGGRVGARTARSSSTRRGAAALVLERPARRAVDDGHRPRTCFPFKPQWLSASEISTPPTAGSGGVGSARPLEDGLGSRRPGSVTAVPFTAKVSLQRSTYTIAHRALEPAEPQKLTGIVEPGRVARRPRDRVHRDGRSLGAARPASRRCS